MTTDLCAVCNRRLDHDHDPYYVASDPNHYADECGRLFVVFDNGVTFPACWSCWFKWPRKYARRWFLPDEDQPGDEDRLVNLSDGSPVPVLGGWT